MTATRKAGGMRLGSRLDMRVVQSVFGQPLLPGDEIRHRSLQPLPEIRCVVGLMEMYQLVSDDVFHHAV